MTVTKRAVASALVLAIVLGGSAGLALAIATPAAAGDRDATARKVVIVTFPRLTWQQVVEQRPPTLLGLLPRSAIASTSVRTVGARTLPGEAYTSLGAGNRAAADERIAGLAMAPDASFEGGPAVQAWERRTGRTAKGEVLHVGIGEIRRENADLLYDAKPGALGSALVRAGLSAGVVANADVPEELHREAALAVMDQFGEVAAGDVDLGLLTDDSSAPFGRRLDDDAVVTSFRDALRTSDVVVLEMSDLERADLYLGVATPAGGRLLRAAAIERADRMLGRVLEAIDLDRDLLVAIGPTAPRAREQLTIGLLAGAGVEPGWARSPTTRRSGYVALTDIGPTVLEALDVDVPDEMTGTAITTGRHGTPTLDDVRDLAVDNEVAIFRDRAVGPVTVAFIVFQVLVYGVAALALLTGQAFGWVGRVASFGALMTLAFPPLVYLSGLTRYDRLGTTAYTLILFGGAVVLAAGAWAVARRTMLGPPLALAGLTLGLLIIDVATGAHLQINTPFGYSPIIAGRFAGFGNQAFALLAMASIVVGTGLWAARIRGLRGEAPATRDRVAVALVAGVLAVTLLADGHPALGSDVGGVLALVPAFAVVGLLLAGARVGLRRLLLLGVAPVAVLAGFALLDVTRPEADRTHLGRLVARVFDDGTGSLANVVERKAQANISILLSSVWTLLIPVALAFLAVLTWRQPRLLRQLQERLPGFRACLVGGLVAGLIGFAVNDSGVAVPAMMLAVILPYVTFLAMRLRT